jgi:NAD(P)-dependent dehydrogenase (short-subunit alcohol dehydrogenase family)
MQKIAIVTGGNRGIGFEICRQLARMGIKVILTARDESKGKDAVRKLQYEGLDVVFYSLDITDEQSIKRLAGWVEQTFNRIDILINNAAINIDEDCTALKADINKIKETMETNVYGPLRLCQALVPIMRKNNFGRIVNVSSGAGALNEMTTGSPGYRISKTALNVITKLLGNELVATNITVNSLCPGRIRTDMNPNGERSVEQGADTAIWLADENLETGKFFRDRKEIPW